MTAREMLEWEVYDSMYPIGGRRGDIQTAHLASIIYNVIAAIAGNKNKDKPLEDFMLFKYDDDEGLSQDQLATKVATLLGAPLY